MNKISKDKKKWESIFCFCWRKAKTKRLFSIKKSKDEYFVSKMKWIVPVISEVSVMSSPCSQKRPLEPLLHLHVYPSLALLFGTHFPPLRHLWFSHGSTCNCVNKQPNVITFSSRWSVRVQLKMFNCITRREITNNFMCWITPYQTFYFSYHPIAIEGKCHN